MSRFPHLRALALVLVLLAVPAAACGRDGGADRALHGDPPAAADTTAPQVGPDATGEATSPAGTTPEAGVDARMVPELPVAQAAALPDGAPASVRAVVWADAAGYWLCEALEASTPPSCAGQRLAVTDPGGLIPQLHVALSVDGEVAWSAEPAVVWGYRRGVDGFEPDPAASGGDTAELSGSY